MTPAILRVARRKPSGFSLLEVLIAVVVLSIGLLGLAALQFSALRGNNQSYERSQAHLLAYEIADLMRANRVAAADGAFEVAAGTAPPLPAVDCAAASCGIDDAAAFALSTWHRRMLTLLPGGTAVIACSTPACGPGVLHSIQVIWDENRTGLGNAAGAATSCPGPGAFDETLHLACVQLNLSP